MIEKPHRYLPRRSVMRRIIVSISVLIFLMWLFLYVDQSPFVNYFEIHPYVQILVGLVVLTTIVAGAFQRISVIIPLLLWGGIYYFVKIFIFNNQQTNSEFYAYQTIVELVVLSASIYLASDITKRLHNLYESIANISLVDVSNRVMNFDNCSEVIEREFIRSRRYNSPLSVIVIELDPNSGWANLKGNGKQIFKSLLKRYSISSLVRMIDKHLRYSDFVFDDIDKQRLILLLPETDSMGSRIIATRIRKMAQEQLGITIVCGYASFPDEALTFEELVRQVEVHFMQRPLETHALEHIPTS